MKKLLLIVLTIVFCLTISGCKNAENVQIESNINSQNIITDNPTENYYNTINTTVNLTPTKNEIVAYVKSKKVLNRYVSESLVRTDLTFGEILNDQYFTDIEWNLITYNENTNIVTFKGIPIDDPSLSYLLVEFTTNSSLNGVVGIYSLTYIMDGEKMSWSIDTTSNETIKESDSIVSLMFESVVIGISKTFQAEWLSQAQEEVTTSTTTNKAGESYSNDTFTYKTVIADGGLRIRNAPSIDGEKIGVIPNGTTIFVNDIQNGWAHIVYNEIYGWCSTDYLYDVN